MPRTKKPKKIQKVEINSQDKLLDNERTMFKEIVLGDGKFIQLPIYLYNYLFFNF